MAAEKAAESAIQCTLDPLWTIVDEGFNLAREHEIESLFAVSNGYVGTRAALAEGSRLSKPATFLAGVFDKEHQSPNVPELSVGPDWMNVSFLVENIPYRMESGEILLHRRILDMKQALAWRYWRQQVGGGPKGNVMAYRLASLADRHLLLQYIRFSAENFSARAKLVAAIRAPIDQLGRAELTPLQKASLRDGEHRVLLLHATATGTRVAFATSSYIRRDDGTVLRPVISSSPDKYEEHWDLVVEQGRIYQFERFVVVYTSRESDAPDKAALGHLARVTHQGFDHAVQRHTAAWKQRWQDSSIEIDGDEEMQRAVRFAEYHLIGAANPDDEGVSIGARALTGATYKGHVFWDTDIFLVPFYVFTHPESARALLMYRYHTLDGARRNARARGYRGALYAWESADSGDDTTPSHMIMPDGAVARVYCGEQEHHISADVAYAVWQYWRMTQDDRFMAQAGAEILIETARFWASRFQEGDDGRLHTLAVMGPDEYHPSVEDNVYTNEMARWNLECAASLAAIAERRWPREWAQLRTKLDLSEAELERFAEAAAGIYSARIDSNGIVEQFRGYFDLEDFKPRFNIRSPAPAQVLFGTEKVRELKIIKQADVLMLMALLPDRFPSARVLENFNYYESRTDHGSSLSPPVHAWVAARLGQTQKALAYLRMTAQIDLANNMGNAAGGVHMAALGGLWQAIAFGFAGISFDGDAVILDPHLPSHWKGVRMPIHFRGRRIDVDAKGSEAA